MGALLRRDLTTLCERNRDGSFATRADRETILMLCEQQLAEGGFGFKRARGLKPRHIDYLIERWLAEDLKPGTLKNRAAVLRWWATKIGKASIIHRDNGKLGIPDRARQSGDKARRLDLEKLADLPCPYMRMSLRLMAAFGLRREEALKLRPRMADGGDHIALHSSWTKGGRQRVVPILTGRQRTLLDEAIALVGNDSLIPNDMTYIAHRRKLQYRSLKAGISNVHGLRHAYAQWRYHVLTGLKCPASGGPKTTDLSPLELGRDQAVRQIIAEELGHSRASVTRAYLG